MNEWKLIVNIQTSWYNRITQRYSIINLKFGTTIRYFLICSAFGFLTGLVKNEKLSRSTPIKLPSNQPSSY